MDGGTSKRLPPVAGLYSEVGGSQGVPPDPTGSRVGADGNSSGGCNYSNEKDI